MLFDSLGCRGLLRALRRTVWLYRLEHSTHHSGADEDAFFKWMIHIAMKMMMWIVPGMEINNLYRKNVWSGWIIAGSWMMRSASSMNRCAVMEKAATLCLTHTGTLHRFFIIVIIEFCVLISKCILNFHVIFFNHLCNNHSHLGSLFFSLQTFEITSPSLSSFCVFNHVDLHIFLVIRLGTSACL